MGKIWYLPLACLISACHVQNCLPEARVLAPRYSKISPFFPLFLIKNSYMPISLCRRIIFFWWRSVYRSRHRFTRRKEQDRDPFPSSNTHLARTSKLSEDGILPAACSLGLGSHFLTHSPNMKWGNAAPLAPHQSGQGPVPCHAFCFIWATKQSHSRCFDCI